jgi:glycine/D-amino acid oxidase-like deaminating enzyme
VSGDPGTLPTMNQTYDVIVAGAGMLGAASAYRLAVAGRKVLLVEASEPASGATGNSFSWLNAVSKEPEAYHRLNADGMAEYAGLADELGVEIGLHVGGSLQWGANEAEQSAIRRRVDRLAARGYQARWIGRDEAIRLEPNMAIAPGVVGVAYHPGDAWVDAPRVTRALVNRALAEGAELLRGTPVRAFVVQGDRVIGVRTDRGDLTAEQVLLCAGTATPSLLAPLDVQLPVNRVPGLLAVTSPLADQLSRVVYAPGVHLRPDVEGGLRIGADDIDGLTTEETPAEPAPAYAHALLERAQSVFPPARGAAITRVLIGIRPVPADEHTVAGRVPGPRNLWVLVTHSGITLGPLLGRLIAAEMDGGTPDPRLTPFRPDRFQSAAERNPSAP